MAIEDHLLTAYAIGTQEELQAYGGKQWGRNVLLGCCYAAEFGVTAALPFLPNPNNLGTYAFGYLLADVGVRWVRGILNLASNYKDSRKDRSTIGFNMLADFTEQPGVIGDIRELANWTVSRFTRN